MTAAPSDPALAGALALALGKRAQVQPGFAEALDALWGVADGAHYNLIAGGVQNGPVFQIGNNYGPVTVHTSSPDSLPAHLQDPEAWPATRDWDGLLAGVHRARPGQDGSVLPPYVPRDIDEELRALLTAAAGDGGLVLVTGDSTSGKTRAAFEALRASLPDHRVVQPADHTELPGVARAVARSSEPCVVWLDDLERYLGPGPDSLTPALLSHFAAGTTALLATMRLRQYETYTADHDRARGTAGANGGAHKGVLAAARRVNLDRMWSGTELARARACADDRITHALAHHGPHGIAEYLAAGPALLDDWHTADRPGGHPRGAALVATAVDLSRTGLPGPYPRSLLLRLHEQRLAQAGGALLRPETADEAFAWAGALRFGVTSLLLPGDEPDTWMPFDYLVDRTEDPLPSEVWDEALMNAPEPAARFAVGFSALQADLPHVAEAAWRPHAHTVPIIASWLGRLLDAQERPGEAEEVLRAAIRAGSVIAATDLGLLLARTHRPNEAEAWLRLAARYDDARAMYLHGELLRQTGREAEAEHWFRRAEAAGSQAATTAYGILLADLGRTEAAEEQLSRAADADLPGAAAVLGLLLVRTGRPEEAEELTRRPLPEPSFARLRLSFGLKYAGFLLNRPDRAELEYARTALLSRIEAAGAPGGGVFLLSPDLAEDDEYTHWSANHGNVFAALDLAGLGPGDPSGFENELHRRIIEAGRSGDNAQAAALARPAADEGDSTARSMLITALTALGREDEALPYARAAVADDEDDKAWHLAGLLYLTGRQDEAEQYLPLLGEKQAEDTYREARFFRLMEYTARMEEAEGIRRERPELCDLSSAECRRRVEGYLRLAARLGHFEAAAQLADVLDKSGRSTESTLYHRQAADGGDLRAAFITAERLQRDGDVQAAERYYRRAADRDHSKAARHLARLLGQSGRRGEARAYRRRAAQADRRADRLEAGILQRATWCLLTLGSLGLLSWVPFLYVALRRGRRRDWWTCAAFFVVQAVVVTAVVLITRSPGDRTLEALQPLFGSLMHITLASGPLMLAFATFDRPRAD
ncbi:tetratricopeptide repeat protein [Streptomyces sp. TG1A-60]|uniref:tetratricopeptide repeat protein n=1 Tax=Streptomyces sp. TG1A-60 TaxID=3129111 RepID=UPI0030D020AF